MSFKKKFPLVLTYFRIIGSIAFIFFAHNYFNSENGSLFLASMFSLLGFTDFLDGYLAKKWHTTSRLGSILDPMADKILCTGTLLIFLEYRLIPLRVVSALIMRDIIVSSAREYAVENNIAITPSKTAKFKTCILMVVITAILLYPVVTYNEDSMALLYSYSWIMTELWALIIALSIYSAFSYLRILWKRRHLSI